MDLELQMPANFFIAVTANANWALGTAALSLPGPFHDQAQR